MFFQGDLSSDKTEKLIENYANLLNSGIDSSKILVILQNSNRKNEFIEKTLSKLKTDVIEKLQVYSFWGLVYNTISDNWADIENKIPDFKNTKIQPNLTGLEISQYIFKQIIKDIKFEGYNSKKSLLHQLFRRYSLIVQNNLSQEDIKWRSECVLKESFAPDANAAVEHFKKETLELRAFDYLRQSLIFNHIYAKQKYFANIEYLIVDDADEIIPVCFEFIKFLKPQLKDFYIAYDEKGSSRSGYLSADKNAVAKLKEIFSSDCTVLEAKSTLKSDSETIFSNIVEQKNSRLQRFALFSFSKRAKMLDMVSEKIKELINSGISPCNIAVVTPVIDDMLKFCLKENLIQYCNFLSLSGNEKLIQNRIVKAILTILKIGNSCEYNEFDMRAVFDFLQIPLKYCISDLKHTTFPLEEYTQSYDKFLAILNELPKIDKLSRQVYKIYDDLVDIKRFTKEELKKFSFFVSQIEEYENVFPDIEKSDIIKNIENSIISENPYSTLEVNENDLVVATPQKIIDNQIKTKYQLWLDVSSDEWIKSDTGPLYNAWVMQKDWEKDEYTISDNIELSTQKNARILRKLTLCANSFIFAYASLFDSSGIENFGGIESFLNIEKAQNAKAEHKSFTPRDDQKPVLEYKKGTMAISAVPGAGKTTILLELILKLLKDGIKPENIFVLTYMESAARNFRERIQSANPNMNNLPNISTIHGLALKILKENDNFERLGLNQDFEICDDSQRGRILDEIFKKYEIKTKTEKDEFDRAASILKMGRGVNVDVPLPVVSDKKLSKFLLFYSDYEKRLKSENLIDYDDMLLMSVRLLEETPDIADYYREICQYIIEDEAQDSSAIQQKLINILCAKHKNLIRCGDINQAITTTFSNADVQGFRNFINSAETKISMNSSQRCTKDVWELANNLVRFSQAQEHSKDAFYNIFMQPVKDKNPIAKNAVKSLILDNEPMEKNFVLKKIKEILTKEPKATIGILLRSNFSVSRWTTFVGNSGLKTITRSECLEQKTVFRVIYAIMKIIEKPFDNQNIADNYLVLAEAGLSKSGLFDLIKQFQTPFVQQNVDTMNNIGLEQLYWDINYWLSFANLSPEEMAIKIGLYYFSTDVEKSNVYLISTLIKRVNQNCSDYSELMEKIGTLAKKSSLSGFKFFSEEEKSDKEILEGKVQVMTLHKSKGDEFDYVFLPDMTEKSLPILFENVSLNRNEKFMSAVRELNPKYKAKTEDESKEFLLAENLRLMYVAITRAKKGLFITSSKKEKVIPSAITNLIGGV